MIGQRHGIMMHGIADLTFFGHSGLVLCRLVHFVFRQVLVSIYHHLSCREAE